MAERLRSVAAPTQRVISAARQHLVARLAGEILCARDEGVTRVAVDGVDGAGKTMLADELATVVGAGDREVIRASVDDFHNPRSVRYQRGRQSPEGFFLDSHDYDLLRRLLLDPLAPGGCRRFRRRAFDVSRDEPVDAAPQTAPDNAILILDGIFLHRHELRELWDYSIFLDVAFESSVARCVARDNPAASVDVNAPANRRYVAGQQLYIATCNPHANATRLIDNNSLAAPVIVR